MTPVRALLAAALVVCFFGCFAGLCRADESAPSASNQSATPEKASKAGEGVSTASGTPDSVIATVSVQDSAKSVSETEPTAKDTPPPAGHVENAVASPPEKPPETVPAPPVKHADPQISVPHTTAPKTDAPQVKGQVRTPPQGAKPRAGKAVVRRSKPSRPGFTKRTARRSVVAVSPPGSQETDRVLAQLVRTDRYMSRTQRSVMLSKNTRAIKLYTSAIEFQADAREAHHVRQFARAERLTVAARDFADRASRMVGPPREDPEYVERVLKRTDDALERAKDVLQNGATRRSWDQLNGLRNNQKEAWKTFKTGGVGTAYNRTLGIREGVLGLLRQLEDVPVPRETAEKAIDGAQALLEQANKDLGPKPNGEVSRQVRLATEYLAKARQSFQRGSYRPALLQAKVVERHIEHAIDAARSRT